jgi:subtilisin family serine protease
MPGEKVTVKRKAWGDPVNNNNIWILSDESDFYSSEGFEITNEFKSLQIRPPLFDSLKISELWKESKGEGVNIGVIDNGVFNHPALNNKVVQLNSHIGSDINNHATTMACIIGASDEKSGKIGVAPMVNKIFSYQINIDDNNCNIEASELFKALDNMDKASVQIINMSFTCDRKSFFPTTESGKLVQDKINSLFQKQVILVCATGNNSKHDSPKANRFPAGYENVTSVTGFNFSGSIDSLSNCWNGVTISTLQEHYFEDNQFEKSNGTSGATAIIAGCLACVYNKLPSSKNQTLKAILSQMSLEKDPFGPFSVPKFDVEKFINFINQFV